MKRLILTTIIVLSAVIGSVGQLHAVDISFDFSEWTTSGPITSYSYSGTSPNVLISGTLTDLGPVDIVVPMLFGNVGPIYSFSITLTNQTSYEWTDFHFETGNGTGSEYETSSGQDQPLFLTEISSNRFESHSLMLGDGEEGEPAYGIFDVGIDWFDGTVPAGQTVTFSFLLQANDTVFSPPGTPPTQWNSDYYPYTSPSGQSGFLETFRIFPTTEAVPVPEPSTLLLLGSGLVGLVGFRRKFKI